MNIPIGSLLGLVCYGNREKTFSFRAMLEGFI